MFDAGDTNAGPDRTDNISRTIKILGRHKVELLQASRMYRLD